MIIKVTKGNKKSSFEMSQEAWDLFYERDFTMYKIRYAVHGYELVEDGDKDKGFIELYYNGRMTIRQEWK